MPLYSVHSNRSAGERDYEVQGLIWARDHRAAALRFASDWIDLGWRPGTIVVTDLEPDGPPRLFSCADNFLVEEP